MSKSIAQFRPFPLLGLITKNVDGIRADVRCHVNGLPAYLPVEPEPKMRTLKKVSLQTFETKAGDVTWLRWEWHPEPGVDQDPGYAGIYVDHAAHRQIRLERTPPEKP